MHFVTNVNFWLRLVLREVFFIYLWDASWLLFVLTDGSMARSMNYKWSLQLQLSTLNHNWWIVFLGIESAFIRFSILLLPIFWPPPFLRVGCLRQVFANCYGPIRLNRFSGNNRNTDTLVVSVSKHLQ